ncbi:hypothetical protein [Thiocapsa marina]|uniref:Uncharacterized protein n=1 Tax=Thiocapsa marina 5811 TaxID=768671 RepID=F9UB64_9GAMM|nr:hypothetical protein [Thiocapsa marina]EGV18682.1 hypothetical protein ThimaDRAFT_2100 [Thiocapsa marina 5811]
MNDLRYGHIGAARRDIVNAPLPRMEKAVRKYPLRGALFKLNASVSPRALAALVRVDHDGYTGTNSQR